MSTKKPAAKAKPADGSVPGRALVDIPEYGLLCGEYGSLPVDAAQGLIEAGKFDPKAVQG